MSGQPSGAEPAFKPGDIVRVKRGAKVPELPDAASWVGTRGHVMGTVFDYTLVLHRETPETVYPWLTSDLEAQSWR